MIFCYLSIIINVQLEPFDPRWCCLRNFFYGWRRYSTQDEYSSCLWKTQNQWLIFWIKYWDNKQLNVPNPILKLNLPSAALAVALSPSGCAIRCIAVGAIPIGMDTSFPRTLVFIQRCETSTIIFGISRYLEMKGYVRYTCEVACTFTSPKLQKFRMSKHLKRGYYDILWLPCSQYIHSYDKSAFYNSIKREQSFEFYYST